MSNRILIDTLDSVMPDHFVQEHVENFIATRQAINLINRIAEGNKFDDVFPDFKKHFPGADENNIVRYIQEALSGQTEIKTCIQEIAKSLNGPAESVFEIEGISGDIQRCFTSDCIAKLPDLSKEARKVIGIDKEIRKKELFEGLIQNPMKTMSFGEISDDVKAIAMSYYLEKGEIHSVPQTQAALEDRILARVEGVSFDSYETDTAISLTRDALAFGALSAVGVFSGDLKKGAMLQKKYKEWKASGDAAPHVDSTPAEHKNLVSLFDNYYSKINQQVISKSSEMIEIESRISSLQDIISRNPPSTDGPIVLMKIKELCQTDLSTESAANIVQSLQDIANHAKALERENPKLSASILNQVNDKFISSLNIEKLETTHDIYIKDNVARKVVEGAIREDFKGLEALSSIADDAYKLHVLKHESSNFKFSSFKELYDSKRDFMSRKFQSSDRNKQLQEVEKALEVFHQPSPECGVGVGALANQHIDKISVLISSLQEIQDSIKKPSTKKIEQTALYIAIQDKIDQLEVEKAKVQNFATFEVKSPEKQTVEETPSLDEEHEPTSKTEFLSTYKEDSMEASGSSNSITNAQKLQEKRKVTMNKEVELTSSAPPLDNKASAPSVEAEKSTNKTRSRSQSIQ